MKNTFSKAVICAAGISALVATQAARAATYTYALDNVQLDGDHGVSKFLSIGKVFAGSASKYSVTFKGTVHGVGGLAAFVPPGTTFAQLFERIKPGSNSQIQGAFPAANAQTLVISNLTNFAPNSGTLTEVHLSVNLNLTPGQFGFLGISILSYFIDSVDKTNIHGLTDSRGSIVIDPGSKLIISNNPQPFDGATGTYSGLISLGSGDATTYGIAKVTLSASGAFTLKYTLGGKAYSVVSFAAPNVPTVLPLLDGRTLTVTCNPVTQQVTLALVDSLNNSSTTVLRPPAFSKTAPFDRAGRYTLLLEPAAGGPVGSSFATLNVSAAGNVSTIFTLADGTKFSQSTPIATGRTLPVYAPLYAKAGSLAGVLTFNDAVSANDLDGPLVWSKPANLLSKHYPAGFVSYLEGVGSRYVKPLLGNLVLNLPAATLQFSGGGVTDFSQAVTVSTSNVSTAVLPDLNKVKLSFTKGTGAISGNFFLPDISTTQRFQGVVLQTQLRAGGFFAGPRAIDGTIEAGSVDVVATQAP